jgi:hypothetical protein
VCHRYTKTNPLPAAIAVVAFTVLFRLLEDYLLSPRVMRATVEVAPLLSDRVRPGGALLASSAR